MGKITRVGIELEVPYPLGTLFMTDRKISGIYIIQNVFSDRCYVGATQDVPQRWRSHYGQLATGSHVNKDLQNEFANDPDVLIFRLLEICPVSQLRDREINHARVYEAYAKEWGYNIKTHRYPDRSSENVTGRDDR